MPFFLCLSVLEFFLFWRAPKRWQIIFFVLRFAVSSFQCCSFFAFSFSWHQMFALLVVILCFGVSSIMKVSKIPCKNCLSLQSIASVRIEIIGTNSDGTERTVNKVNSCRWPFSLSFSLLLCHLSFVDDYVSSLSHKQHTKSSSATSASSANRQKQIFLRWQHEIPKWER